VRTLLWALLGVAGAALATLFSVWAPPDDPFFSLCLFRRLLAIPCPGCGLTRAVAALARGDLGAALAYHPAAPVLVAEAAGLWLVWGAALLRRRALPALLRRQGDGLLLAHGAALVALWTGRLATGTLPW
jgi:hypothetical protein